MRIKYNNERFFYLEEQELNRLKELFEIFKLYDNANEDILIGDICCYSKYDTKNVYKVVYYFYNFINDYDNDINLYYKEVINIVDYLCPGDDVLIWIYKKYGKEIIINFDKNSKYYMLYIKYLEKGEYNTKAYSLFC